ncbi:MAG: ferredoxin [bacterium]|nr:ferredoxin [bacterium]
MRIEVKRDLCIGASSCVAVAPGVFELDSELKAIVKEPRGDDEHTILEAARACPTLAIYLYDDDGKQVFPPPVSATP